MKNNLKNFNNFSHKNLFIHNPPSLLMSYNFDGFFSLFFIIIYHQRITNFSTILLTPFPHFSTTLNN